MVENNGSLEKTHYSRINFFFSLTQLKKKQHNYHPQYLLQSYFTPSLCQINESRVLTCAREREKMCDASTQAHTRTATQLLDHLVVCVKTLQLSRTLRSYIKLNNFVTTLIMEQEIEFMPTHVRYLINIATVFVTWVALESWFNPVQRHLWADAEMLNAVGSYTIPLCFIVILFFVLRHYERKYWKQNS